MADFPLLKTKAVTQYPSSRSLEFSTGVLRFVDGSEQRYRQMRQPVRRWMLRLGDVSEEELYAIQAFFESRQGQTGSFAFTDPWDGTEYPDCSFEQDEFEIRLLAEGHAAGAVLIRNNQV
jgi:uncharacterized protein (TIGR02217 family)